MEVPHRPSSVPRDPPTPIPAARSQYLLDLLAQVPDPRKKRLRAGPARPLHDRPDRRHLHQRPAGNRPHRRRAHRRAPVPGPPLFRCVRQARVQTGRSRSQHGTICPPRAVSRSLTSPRNRRDGLAAWGARSSLTTRSCSNMGLVARRLEVAALDSCELLGERWENLVVESLLLDNLGRRHRRSLGLGPGGWGDRSVIIFSATRLASSRSSGLYFVPPVYRSAVMATGVMSRPVARRGW